MAQWLGDARLKLIIIETVTPKVVLSPFYLLALPTAPSLSLGCLADFSALRLLVPLL